MKYLTRSALLISALATPLAVATVPATAQEAAEQSTLITVKSDRGAHSATALSILASIASED